MCHFTPYYLFYSERMNTTPAIALSFSVNWLFQGDPNMTDGKVHRASKLIWVGAIHRSLDVILPGKHKQRHGWKVS